MTHSVGIVILAAGKGTRMKLDLPKPLAPIMGRRLVDFVLEEASEFLKSTQFSGEISIVTGHQREVIETYINETHQNKKIKFCLQDQLLGTADALRAYFSGNSKAKNYEYTLIMCADTPLIEAHVYHHLYEKLQDNQFDAVAATFTCQKPTGYGRILRAEKGFQIVEEKEANDEQRKICEVNSGLYLVKTQFVLKHIDMVKADNAVGEFYLTDIFKKGELVGPVLFEDAQSFLGVNDLLQLSFAERTLRNRLLHKLLLKGVRIVDPSHTYCDSENIGEGTIIHPNVTIDAKTTIGKNTQIESGSILNNSMVGSSVVIKAYSYIDHSVVKDGASIGPFAHLRSEANIGEDCRIGNFVEIKKSNFLAGSKASHLSYIGDAEIGEGANLGCGFITCNYDGAQKHKTVIGKGTFIGSDSQMIAPISVGENCYVASGSTINQDMKDGDFAIARSRQVTRPGMARRFIKKK